MENEIQARKYLNLANDKYLDYLKKWRTHIQDKGYEWDEDVFSDTILKVYDNILKNGIKDDSEEGLSNYWFKSFIVNIKREKQYSRNLYRDMNVDASEELDKEYNGDDELKLKIRRHIYDDWLSVRLLQIVEQNFTSREFRCFRLYYIVPKMTYEKLRDLTKIKDCKKIVNTIKKWLIENTDKHQLDKEFSKWYDND
jgi:hypothetical protein